MPCISLVSGKVFDLEEPEKHPFSIRDIAHSLSNLCRWVGHTKTFYSVAQHSVIVSELVPEEFALLALLHDASEAFLGDVSRPLKAVLPEYNSIETRLNRAIFEYFGVQKEIPPLVHQADLAVLVTEARDLMRGEIAISGSIAPLSQKIYPWSPNLACNNFLGRFYELAGNWEEK